MFPVACGHNLIHSLPSTVTCFARRRRARQKITLSLIVWLQETVHSSQYNPKEGMKHVSTDNYIYDRQLYRLHNLLHNAKGLSWL